MTLHSRGVLVDRCLFHRNEPYLHRDVKGCCEGLIPDAAWSAERIRNGLFIQGKLQLSGHMFSSILAFCWIDVAENKANIQMQTSINTSVKRSQMPSERYRCDKVMRADYTR